MIALIQRVLNAQVTVEQQQIAVCEQGIVALVAVEQHDAVTHIERMANKLLNYRIFSDSNGKMNLSVMDVQGCLMLVPQFTLIADTKRGNRPSFSRNINPSEGKARFLALVDVAKQRYTHIQQGEFGADMQVSLTNDGPVTFWLQV